MASSTTDHHLAVHDDEEVGVNLLRCDAPRTSHAYRTRWIVDGRTQWMVLSATIANPVVSGTGRDTQDGATVRDRPLFRKLNYL